MGSITGHTILLGGIGGDSHSVGLNILRQALTANGYDVKYLGIQNRLEHFCERAALCNLVMISSMDGHTRYYLRDFPEMVKRYKANKPLWYLGGNLHIGDANGYERRFLDMGFDRVFVKFTDVRTVLSAIARDLDGTEPMPPCPELWERLRPANLHIPAPLSDEMLDLEQFTRSRRMALDGWKTGCKAKSLDANAEFLVRQPSFPKAQALVNAGKARMLVQPRSGVPLLSEQLKIFKTFKDYGARVLSYQVDSLTRNNNYAGAEEAIRESRATGDATLNGFPVINHGVGGLRQIISGVNLPLQTRHSTRDPRLLAEISYAGGVTAFEGGAICYNIPYYKDYRLDESIAVWQYVDRLTGLYYERYGIPLDREFFGTLTATLIPPSLAIVTGVIEAVLAVQQGVKCVSLGYAEQGNRNQDIAAIRTMAVMADEIIRNLGYHDVQVNTIFHQYMAAFPSIPGRAEDLIYNSAITAALSGATRVITKTPAEAYKIPTLEDNLHGMNLVNCGINAARSLEIDEAKVSEECAIIRREVQAIFDSIVMCGRGSVATGVVTGFLKGYLDIPFSPSIYNRAEVMTARDHEGAVRFLCTGQLQFDRELQEFHRHKMSERRFAEGLFSSRDNYLLVEKDVMQIARNDYSRWPLFG